MPMSPTQAEPGGAPVPTTPVPQETKVDSERRDIERAVFERRKPPEADNPTGGTGAPKPLGES
jgi:hypothetical protein